MATSLNVKERLQVCPYNFKAWNTQVFFTQGEQSTPPSTPPRNTNIEASPSSQCGQGFVDVSFVPLHNTSGIKYLVREYQALNPSLEK